MSPSGCSNVGRLLEDVARAYRHDIVEAGRQAQFLVLVAFLVTFLLVRALTHAIRSKRAGPFRDVRVGGMHLHHLVPGILLLLVTGYLAIALDVHLGRRLIAVLYGVGAALTLDEFALWLRLEDVYWAAEGRRSIDAVVVASTIAGIVLVGPSFWRDIGHALARVFA